MAIVILGIDLGKNICSLVGVGEDGAVILRRNADAGSTLKAD